MSLVSIGSGCPAFVVGTGSSIGVIVLQEWWGLNAQIKGFSERLASSGFMVLAPDLYRGKVATKADEASHLMDGLDWNVALDDINNSIGFLRERGAKRIAVMGFCMGGALTIAAACRLSNFNGGICFYGVPPPTIHHPKDVKCPLQLHFGDLDESMGFSDPKTAAMLVEGLTMHDKKFEFYSYPANHAFMNETRPEVFDKCSSDLAFERTCNFLNSL